MRFIKHQHTFKSQIMTSKYWGRFTERYTLSTYLFTTNGESKLVYLIANENPILNTVLYHVLIREQYGTLILDAKKIEWSASVHYFYANETTYTEEFDFDFHFERTVNTEFKKWMLFDITYQIQKLIPIAPIDTFRRYVLESNYEDLVYVYGNVVPEQLARFFPEGMNHPLVNDAIVLQYLTQQMITTGRLWMEQSDIILLTYSTDVIQAASTRLIQNHVIVANDNKIAFKWAVDKFNQAVQAGVTVTFEAGKKPKQITDTVFTYTVDTRLPINHFIERKNLPTTLLVSNIPDNLPPAPIMRQFPNKMEMYQFIQTEIAAANQNHPCVVISDTGLECILQIPRRTKDVVRFTHAYGTNIRRYEVVKSAQHWSNSSEFLITKANGSIVHIDKHDYMNIAEPFEHITFNAVLTFTSELKDCILVAIFTQNVCAKWAYELERYESRNKVYYLKV